MEKSRSRTFAVSSVKPATKPLPELDGVSALQNFLGTTVEACSTMDAGPGQNHDPGPGQGPAGSRRLVAQLRSHPLVGALHAAFAEHRPVVLSPDIIWLTLTQGLAQHVNANAKKLRPQLVKHEGQPRIVVRRDDFVKGSPVNPWPAAFGEFSRQIKDYIGAAHPLVVADFSTTGPLERAASEVVLLDAMQAFFSYEMLTLCGIPAITLEGTVDDWRSLFSRVQQWEQFELSWWLSSLEPILQEFVAAASGVVRREFWESIYKWQGPEGSGSPFVSGWIVNLFPYLNNHAARWKASAPPVLRNPWLGRQCKEAGPGRIEFPCLPAKAPFIWDYLGTRYKMEFIGGLVGVGQDPQTLALRPEIGWAVRDEDAPKLAASDSEDGNDPDPHAMMAVL
jgi:hypothetical protein